MDKFDLEEKILGGIFGTISIVATIIEMCANGFSTATVFGAVKDIFGTLVVVVLFITVMKALKPKKAKNFRELLNTSMEKVEANYAPLIRKAVIKETDTDAKVNKLQNFIRYEIGSNMNALFGEDCGNYIRFFDIDATTPNAIVFPIRETFFGNKENAPFNAETIIYKISNSLQKRFTDYQVKGDIKKKEIVVSFNKTLSSYEDAETLCRLIDTVVLLFIAENKK
ncbi:MAG: hypothetical protein IKU23_06795 [Clostridia bacterium]|nr:hypothetical protein [Clostridia bacterium]